MYAYALFIAIISSQPTPISDFPAGPDPNNEPVFINEFFSSIEISRCQSLPCNVHVTCTFNLTRDDLKDIMLSEMISKMPLYQRAEDGSVHTAEGVEVTNIHLSEEFGEDLSSVTVQYQKDTPYRDILTLRVRSKELRRSSASDYSPKSEPRIEIRCSVGGEEIDCENVKGPFTLITSIYTGLGKPSNVTVLPEPDMRIQLFAPRYDFKNYLWERVQQMDVQLLRPGSHRFEFQVTVDGTKTTKAFTIVADFNLTTTPAPTWTSQTLTPPTLPTANVTDNESAQTTPTADATENETGPDSTIDITSVLIGIVICLVIFGIIAVVCWICKRKKETHPGQPTDSPALKYGEEETSFQDKDDKIDRELCSPDPELEVYETDGLLPSSSRHVDDENIPRFFLSEEN